ncbi:MAG: hypothetical protein K2J99_02200 [Lachnospiraceae bacterium]|nr:hypothetical protein [Lachnospiraceae bacterium]
MNKTEALLIPIKLRALLVGETPQKNIYSDFSYDFTSLGDPSRAVEKPLFSQKESRAPGVYLHWSLPDCFTQGLQNENEDEIAYRMAPNRWAVIRMWDSGDNCLHGRAFMVESDILSKSPSGGPSWPWTEDEEQPYRFLGRSFPMESEPETDGSHIRLTAVSPVSPFFAAYAPLCENVFGFYDDLTADKLTNVKLCYLVCGWYHEYGEEEPFKSVKNWEELRIQFGLTGDSNSMEFPSRTLCHGMIDQIDWKDEHTIYHTGIPDDPEPGQVVTMSDIAMGNNTSEALSALITGNQNAEAHYFMNLMLQGFDKDLERRQGIVTAEENLQCAKFGVHHAFGITGIHRLHVADEENHQPLSDEYISRLTTLRKKQRSVAKDYAVLIQKQRNIYENWYLALYADASYKEMYLRRADLAVEESKCYLQNISQEMKKLEREQVELAEQLERAATVREYELIEERDEPFYIPTEPVVLISQDVKSNEVQPVTSPENPLICRVSGQTVTALDIVDIAGISTILTGSSLLPEFSFAQRIPEEIRNDIRDLAAEAVLLSSSFDELLCKRAFQNAGITPTEEQTMELCSKIRSAQNCKEWPSPCFMGTLPDSLALERYAPQWRPLILEWKCYYYPDMNVMSKKPELSRWMLQDGDYIYTCPQGFNAIINRDNEYVVSGRLYISDHAQKQTEVLADRLFDQDSDMRTLAENSIRTKIRLSQMLDGFSSNLLMREQALAPVLFAKDPDQKHYIDILTSLDASAVGERPVFDTLFAPMRAGFLSLSRLRIIDDMGRFQDIDQPDIYAPESMRAPRTESLVHYLMLPPRILQPSRLTAYFIAAGRGEVEEALGMDGCSPICGFVLSNLLDYSLVVYRGDGTLAGSLNIVQLGSEVCWKSPPGVPVSCNIPDDLDSELYAFLQELMLAGAKTLQNLIEYVNHLQTNTQSASHSPSRIELVGKPIAIARLCISLELMGKPEAYRHYVGGSGLDKTSETDIYAAKFPLLTGNLNNYADGTIGFFEDGDYKHMHVYEDVEIAKTLSLDGDSYFSGSHRVELCPDSTLKILTVLFDPWSNITLTTGILPVRTIALEENFVENALQNIAITYFCAPVLTGARLDIPVSHSDSLSFYWEAQKKDGDWKSNVLLYEDENIPDPDEQIYVAEGYICIREKE